jgi:hypothetical protein
MTIQKLVSVLSGVPAGAVPTSMCDELCKLVVASWHEFSGSGESSMGTWKILRDKGPEDVTWSPPCLSFVIDRRAPDPREEPLDDPASRVNSAADLIAKEEAPERLVFYFAPLAEPRFPPLAAKARATV